MVGKEPRRKACRWVLAWKPPDDALTVVSSGEWPDEFDQDLSRPKNDATGLEVSNTSATLLSNELWREAGSSCTESSSGDSGGDSTFGDAPSFLRSGIGAVLQAVSAFFAWVFSFALLRVIKRGEDE
jgi:hypothetical protein